MNKQFKLLGLLSVAFLVMAPTVSAGFLDLPDGPYGIARRLSVGGLRVAGGACLLGLGCYGTAVSALRDFQSDPSYIYLQNASGCFGLVIGGLLGLRSAVNFYNSHSPKGCVDRFNVAYNYFLVVNLLREESSSFANAWTVSNESKSSHWPLVDLYRRLSMCDDDLGRAIKLGRVLISSSDVRALDADLPIELLRKVDHMSSMRELVKDRLAYVQSDPMYRLQAEMKRQHDRMQQQIADAQREYDRIQREVSDLRQQMAVGMPPVVVMAPQPAAPVDVCGLCSQGVSRDARYTTACGCTPGSYFYHHKCIAKALKRSGNDRCPKCAHSHAKVHSAFGDGGVASSTSHVPVDTALNILEYSALLPEPSAPSVVARVCGLCSGSIPANKGYKISCYCTPGRYLYHHECIKTHLRDAHTCPKCYQVDPVVHLDFGDAFASAPVQTNTVPSNNYPAPQIPEPSAPPADTTHTCALCSGHIKHDKRYRTGCDCRAGKYYYHHECVASTLKTNGYRCPKCNKAQTTVHSAF